VIEERLSGMRRPILSLVGVVLLAGPFVLRQFTPSGILELIGIAAVSEHLPNWLQVMVLAGAYLLEWAPALAGLSIIYYANRKQD
jgi:hypothetical protein